MSEEDQITLVKINDASKADGDYPECKIGGVSTLANRIR